MKTPRQEIPQVHGSFRDDEKSRRRHGGYRLIGILALVLGGAVASLLVSCAGAPVVLNPRIPDGPIASKPYQLVSVEIRPANFRVNATGVDPFELMTVWRQQLETALRDERAFSANAGDRVRLVLTPVVMHESLLAYDVRITMRYQFVNAATGRTVEQYEVTSAGHSTKFSGLERSKEAWLQAAKLNVEEFLRESLSKPALAATVRT